MDNVSSGIRSPFSHQRIPRDTIQDVVGGLSLRWVQRLVATKATLSKIHVPAVGFVTHHNRIVPCATFKVVATRINAKSAKDRV